MAIFIFIELAGSVVVNRSVIIIIVNTFINNNFWEYNLLLVIAISYLFMLLFSSIKGFCESDVMLVLALNNYLGCEYCDTVLLWKVMNIHHCTLSVILLPRIFIVPSLSQLILV